MMGMTENKRFEMIITGADGSFYYLDKNTGEKITSTLELENKLNTLHEENIALRSKHTQSIILLKDLYMKKKYTQPDLLCEKLASCNVIITSKPGVTTDPAEPGEPVLAPKRQGIWEDED